MSDWVFAQTSPSQQLALLHHFSMKKQQDGREIEFLITVREYLTPPEPTMKFYATADKKVQQSAAPCTPMGWGPTLLSALSECMRWIEKFPYEGE